MAAVFDLVSTGLAHTSAARCLTMSTVTSATTATDLTGCRAPLGHQHEGYEVMYAGLTEDGGTPGAAVDDTRMIWFIEKCRALENEKLALQEQLAEAAETIAERDEKIRAYKISHIELRNLTAELCSKLKRDTVKKDKAEAKVLALEKKVKALKARTAKAELELRRSQQAFSKHQVKLADRLKEAEAKHERFDQMKDEYEVQLVEKEQAVVSVQSEYEVKLAAKDKEYAASSQTIEEQTVEIQECRLVIQHRDQTIQEMTTAHQEALLVLGGKIEELEQEMARRETQVADSLAAAQKISTQFTEKDRQVHELQTLLETVSTERDELHHVIREFESKDEEQALALTIAKRQLMKEKVLRQELQRQRNLEHIATQDLQLRWRAEHPDEYGTGSDDGSQAEDVPVDHTL